MLDVLGVREKGIPLAVTTIPNAYKSKVQLNNKKYKYNISNSPISTYALLCKHVKNLIHAQEKLEGSPGILLLQELYYKHKKETLGTHRMHEYERYIVYYNSNPDC